MAFCTPRDERACRGGHTNQLPEGCLARIVGSVDTGAAIVKVWRSGDDARRFSEQNAPLLEDFNMPPPERVAAFETTIFESHGTP